MSAVVIRNLTKETHQALKKRASKNGRSTEAEIRTILEQAVHEDARIKIGSALAALGEKFAGVEIDAQRDPAPTKAATFE